MAYRSGKHPDAGLWANNPGEFVSNHSPKYPAQCLLNQSPEEAEQHQRKWLAKFYFGKPAACEVGTSEQMAAWGFVGLYLRAGRELEEGDVVVETDELLEENVIKRIVE